MVFQHDIYFTSLPQLLLALCFWTGGGSGSGVLLFFSEVRKVSPAQVDGFRGHCLQGALLTLDMAEVTVQQFLKSLSISSLQKGLSD